jgi:hypothetical protein
MPRIRPRDHAQREPEEHRSRISVMENKHHKKAYPKTTTIRILERSTP